MKALKIAGIVLLVILVAVLAAGTYIKTALPDTGVAPELTIEHTDRRIQRGSYLANHVAVCVDCHSSRDWTLYSAPMIEGSTGGGGEVFNRQMGFPGVFYAPNITPYNLGSWTDGELLRAITTGVNKEGRALFPVMAFHRFGQMDKEDVYSIIAYIRTLKPVENDVPAPEVDFPVSFLINTMPREAKFTSRPPETNLVEYGGYLVNAAGCVDCHSKTDKGSIIKGTEFGGGMEFKQPSGTVRSSNITFDKATGIGGWTKEQFVQRFKLYTNSAFNSPRLNEGDLNTPMPWMMYAGMNNSDLEAVYAYLKSIKPIQNEVTTFSK